MSGTRLRLFICRECETVDPVPWCATEPGQNPDCGHPQCEDVLEYRVAPHRIPSDPCRFHGLVNVVDVAESDWKKMRTREEVLRSLACVARPGTATPYGAELYAVKANFDADAALCWKQHNRTHNCEDYKSASKRLVPGTGEERRELGLETRARRRPTSTYLCDFCPVKSIIMQRQNSERWRYNYDQ